MILLISVYIRPVGSVNRMEIFKYVLTTYSKIPFTSCYFFIKLDESYSHNRDFLSCYIEKNFSNPQIIWDRYTNSTQWSIILNRLLTVHGKDELVWFTQNDDHPFLDSNTDILDEGLELLREEANPRSSIYFSHWTEILKSATMYNPIIVGNYIKINRTLLDSIQIMKLSYLVDIMEMTPRHIDFIRIDELFGPLNVSRIGNEFDSIIYIPMKELCGHFDGYSHVHMIPDYKMSFPIIVRKHTRESLIGKITAPHHSFWTVSNNKSIPTEWIDHCLKLYDII